jgi:RNA polymerase sigma-70 factor (ECF subfamily)
MSDTPEGRPDFAGLYDGHFMKVYNYVAYRVDDAASADDVVSRVFERALDRLETFDPAAGPVEAWLFGIARNAVADHFRRRRWLSWLPLDAFAERPGRDAKNEDVLLEDESRRELKRALERLDARERELLALKFGADMTNRGIAAHLGIGESNVGVIVHRAVLKLRTALKERP